MATLTRDLCARRTFKPVQEVVVEGKIVAVGLLTTRDIERLGEGFNRCFPVPDALEFEDLLRAIDDAEAAAQARIETRVDARGRSR